MRVLRRIVIPVMIVAVLSAVVFFQRSDSGYVLTGAFITDTPARDDIRSFREDYGKGAFFVLVFIEWESLVREDVLEAIFAEGSTPMVSWEPWYWQSRSGVDTEKILEGVYDEYIDALALSLKRTGKTVHLRFGHEMNGNWYPWSADIIGPETYRKIYRYVKDRFDALGADNVRWIFAINWENVPVDNDHRKAYPGAEYVDYVGLNGYNWGRSQDWSRWMSFQEIFRPIYEEAISLYDKDVLITEFASSTSGGDRADWLREAFRAMKKMSRLKAFVLFNVDKETDWYIDPNERDGKTLKEKLEDPFFRDDKF